VKRIVGEVDTLVETAATVMKVLILDGGNYHVWPQHILSEAFSGAYLAVMPTARLQWCHVISMARQTSGPWFLVLANDLSLSLCQDPYITRACFPTVSESLLWSIIWIAEQDEDSW